MKIAVISSELSEALNMATHAMSARSTLPIMEGVLLETTDGGLCVTCTDGNMTISCSVDATVQEDGSAVLPGHFFVDFVRKLPVGELTISTTQSNRATLSCGGIRSNITCSGAEQFPRIPAFEAKTRVTVPQSLLRSMIQRTAFAISSDETHKILTGSLLEVNPNEVRVVALDGFRLAVCFGAVDTAESDVKAVIPGRVIQEVAKIINGEGSATVTLALAGSQLMIEMEKVKIFATLLEGEYINYRQIIPKAFRTVVKVCDKAALIQCVDRAALMAREGKSNLIKLSIQSDIMNITSNAEMGDFSEEVAIENTGEPLDIAFNVKYIQDALRNIEEDTFLMKFNAPVHPCVITAENEENYLYMVLPVRINA